MIILYCVTGLLIAVSLIFSREKTKKALVSAYKKFLRLVPPFLVITMLVAFGLYLIPEDRITAVLGEDNLLLGTITSSLLGSIAFIPGFIVFPLCGLLKDQGVCYTVLSAFTTTLMMVGILTIPLEREYLGMKLTLIRNAAGFIMALITALATGLVFGELLV